MGTKGFLYVSKMGLPYWLASNNPSIKYRTMDPDYIRYVGQWYSVLLPMVAPYIYQNGGPVIMAQVENEYGSYARSNESDYKRFLVGEFRQYLGPDLVLFTTDGGAPSYLVYGTIEGCYATVDFGVGPNKSIDASFRAQREKSPKGPLVNSEFYPGWFDVWGKPHETEDGREAAKALDYMLSLNASVNM